MDLCAAPPRKIAGIYVVEEGIGTSSPSYQLIEQRALRGEHRGKIPEGGCDGCDVITLY